MVLIEKGKPLWITFALLILLSNFFLYNSATGLKILTVEPNGVILGSILDLLIMAPLFIWLTLKKKTLKTAILLSAAGCVVARLMIPNQLLQPFETITWAGIAIQGVIIAIELLLIVTFFRYLPKIVSQVKTSTKPVLFSFFDAMNQYVPKNVVIQMLCSELLMFYYALFSWRKKPVDGFTLYKNTSHIPFMITIIHAIVLETLAFHWWLHEKSFVLSMVLLVFNVYSVLFFIADMFALRLNPTQIKDGHLYLSMGLMKRSKIKLSDIATISQEKEELEAKIDKQTASFIVKEFEEGSPQLLLYMKESTKVTLMMGYEKQYTKIAIQCDQPEKLIEKINEELAIIEGHNLD